ncbi:MAG: NADP-dependent malic enzyme [archaeon]
MDRIYSDSLKLHYKLKGKLEIRSKSPLSSNRLLALNYTPGVAQACREIFAHPKKVFDLTIKDNTVAIVTDGSRVLGLGNIGALAALPVMEGKAMIFKEFAGINAFPICIKSQDLETIVETVRQIAPVFGAINLEDIEAPKCFEVLRQLQDLGIPVIHDDQHGTAVVVLAALINAAKVVKKPFRELSVVVNGAGAAGTAIAKLLLCIGVGKKVSGPVKSVIVVDSKGIIFSGRDGLNAQKAGLAEFTNLQKLKGGLADAIVGADVFIGVSHPNVLSKEMVALMAKGAIVFALANPEPEISPKEALLGGAAVVGTGRSDYPNQINNAVAFPGIFKGVLMVRASQVNPQMLVAAAHAIASVVKNPSKNNFIPAAFHKGVVKKIAFAVGAAAIESGVTGR